MKTDIIISINVHEKPEYLLNQIENINKHVKLNKKIILNCNDYMLKEMSARNIPDVEVFPEAINKKPFHGSLTHGIVCNMSHAINNYEFDYFLVLSSREFFYKDLNDASEIERNIVDSNTIQTGHIDFGMPNYYKPGHYCEVEGDHVMWHRNTKTEYRPYNSHLDPVSIWWWPKICKTGLYKYIKDNNMSFAHSMHEGMCYRSDGCEYIMNFFEKNEDLMYELFEFDCCVEEFALQSISVNHKGFYYLGNGCDTKSLEEVNPDKFTYKKTR